MRKIHKEEILEQIQRCFDKHGKVNRRILNDDDEYCSGKTVYNKFGSFANACEEAGVPHDNKPQKKEKIVVTCASCSSTHKVHEYRLEKSENGRFFCDHKCQGEWWSNNLTGEDHPLYKGYGDWANKMGSKWHVKRENCLDRDNYKCQVCGISQAEHREENGYGLDVHHIEPRQNFYNDKERSIDEANKMENLVTLCRSHHNKVEAEEIEVNV